MSYHGMTVAGPSDSFTWIMKASPAGALIKDHLHCVNHLKALCASAATVLVFCPQALQTEYGGFVSRRLIDDYLYYADALFANFGNRVKNWITFNEPSTLCVLHVSLEHCASHRQLSCACAYGFMEEVS